MYHHGSVSSSNLIVDFFAAPPYLSQHNVVPSKWSYLNYEDPMILTKKHYAIFSMPPPYHSTPNQSKTNLDTNMNSSLTNRNHSNNSSPLIGYDSQPGLLGHDIQFEKCKPNEEFRLFDPNDAVYLDDGMGFDLQSVLSMELLENSDNPRLVEAKNEEVLRRVTEMQKLVKNSEQYLTEHAENGYDSDLPYKDILLRDELVGKETSVDQPESDSESNNSRMSCTDDAPGILKHSDSLLLLTETINQGLSGLTVPGTNENKDNNSSNLSRRQSQGLSAILHNCGLTDALMALNNDFSQSESDNDSLYTPTNSPIRRHQNKTTNNKNQRTSFGLHTPDNAQPNSKEQQNLKDYLKELREKSNKDEQKVIPCVEVSPFCYQEEAAENDAELIDLTLIPPPQTPDELDATSQVPQILPVVPASFADDKDSNNKKNDVDTCDGAPPTKTLEEFIANVTVPPPTVKVTPAIELTPEEIMSYIIPPPPSSNSSTLDRETVSYVNQNELRAEAKVGNSKIDINKATNGDIVKGTLSVSEIRNIFTAKTLSEARNSLLLKEKNVSKSPPQTKSTDSPRGKRKSLSMEKQSNGTANHVIEYPTVERKGMFSCCSKDKSKSEESGEEGEKIETKVAKSDSIPDVCEIRPPPRRKNHESYKPPERPPKMPPVPAPRPRSNSFSCQNNEISAKESKNNHFSTLNNRKLNYKVICDANEQGILQPTDPPSLPPRSERRVLSPPPPLLLPPKKPPLPPVSGLDVLRMKTSQRNPNERRLASIGSPHFQRNLNTYRNLESESVLTEDDRPEFNGHGILQPRVQSMTLQNRHARSHSETKNTILKSNETPTAQSLYSPQTHRKFSNRPDLLNGAPVTSIRSGSPGPAPKSQNHVRFKDEVADDIPTPPSPPSAKFPELGASNGHVSVEGVLRRADAGVGGLLSRLHAAAQHCAHQHAHGGGEDIDEAKFQVCITNTSFLRIRYKTLYNLN